MVAVEPKSPEMGDAPSNPARDSSSRGPRPLVKAWAAALLLHTLVISTGQVSPHTAAVINDFEHRDGAFGLSLNRPRDKQNVLQSLQLDRSIYAQVRSRASRQLSFELNVNRHGAIGSKETVEAVPNATS